MCGIVGYIGKHSTNVFGLFYFTIYNRCKTNSK